MHSHNETNLKRSAQLHLTVGHGQRALNQVMQHYGVNVLCAVTTSSTVKFHHNNMNSSNELKLGLNYYLLITSEPNTSFLHSMAETLNLQ